MEKEENNQSHEEQQKSQDDNLVKSIFDENVKRTKQSSLFNSEEKTPAEIEAVKPETVEPTQKIEPVQAKTLPFRFGRTKKLLPIGIDIGFGSIKLIQLALIENRPKIDKLILKELPIDLIENSQKRREMLPEILRELFKKHNISGNAYSAVPTSDVNLRNLNFPKMPSNEIQASVKWELKRLLGEKMDDITYDYVVLNENKVNQLDTTDVLAITAPKQDILDHISLLESLGLKMQAVEAESFSLAASLNHNLNISPNKVVMLLDFGANSTTLNMVKNNELQFSRVLSINGSALTTAIKDYCQVSYQEAERIKRNYVAGESKSISNEPTGGSQLSDPLNAGISAYNTEFKGEATQIKNAITLLLEKLVSDIDHTFKYYSYQLTKSEVKQYNRIIISGGMANFQMLVPFLKSRINIPIEIDQPLGALDVTSETVTDVGDLKKDAVRFGVAVGLALRGLD